MKLLMLLKAIVVLLFFGLLLVEISYWFFPLILPSEFALYYCAGVVLVLVFVGVGFFINFLRNEGKINRVNRA